MKDIHSHVLFGVDDGAKNIEDSLELIKMAKSIGYDGIVCSSHFCPEQYENKNYDRNFEILKNRLIEEKIDVTLYKGNEVALHPDVFNKLNIINTINNGKYILIELHYGIIFQTCAKFLAKLQSLGYKPILAHIERYYKFTAKQFIELYNTGVILQVNIRQINYLSQDIKYLFKQRYIGLVATDSHNLTRRSYDVGEYLDYLKNFVGDEYFNILTEENPSKILNNQEIKKGEVHNEKTNNRNIFTAFWNKLFPRNGA